MPQLPPPSFPHLRTKRHQFLIRTGPLIHHNRHPGSPRCPHQINRQIETHPTARDVWEGCHCIVPVRITWVVYLCLPLQPLDKRLTLKRATQQTLKISLTEIELYIEIKYLTEVSRALPSTVTQQTLATDPGPDYPTPINKAS